MDERILPSRNDDVLNCFPNKLKRFKPPLVPSKDFPSRVSLFIEGQNSLGEDAVNESGPVINDLQENPNKPNVTHWRRAEFTDREAVLHLIENSDVSMNYLFGEPDVPNLIEKSSFALVQFNSKEEIISFTSVFSYPDIPAVPSFEWYPWLERSYRLKDTNPRNTVFIHYMVWDSRYYHDFLKLTLETIFLENSFVSNIIITKPPKTKLLKIFPDCFVQVLPIDADYYKCDCNSLQTLLICLRHSLLERLKIRLAIVEDHDDLMPIAEQHTTRLTELYGDYCLADIIEFPGSPDRKTLVCESKGYAVGFMTISRGVDFELLNSQFDLGVFHGLKKPAAKDKITGLYAEQEEESIHLPEKIDPLLETINSETMLKFLNWQPSLCVDESEFFSNDKSTSEESMTGYNALSSSMTELIINTLNMKLVPKFSAFALSLSESRVSISAHESSSSSTPDRPYSGSTVSEASTPLQAEQSLISLQYYNLPIYNGLPNAFCIEFYAMHNEFDDRLCQDFLEAAFEVFPDLEYCLLTIPSQSPTFPLLDFFTRVTPRPLKRFRQELYVCHRSCVMVTFMRVRRVVKSDLKEIQTLLKGIKNHEHIYADAASSCYYGDSAYQAFILICSKTIVGVAVLCNEYGMEYLAHHYRISDLIDFDLHKIDYHAILKHLVLSPIYQPHARFFLRDIMRMADVTSLYRARYEEAESNWTKSSVITILDQLIPVSPLGIVKYHKPSLGQNAPPPYLTELDVPFSLYHINSRVCGLKKFTSNINVVVVGASEAAYSFLESLLFAPSSAYVTFNNITWVSPHGMGTELPSHEARDLMFPFKGKYSRFYRIQVCLKTYVNFVYGIMTHINRTDKCITINNDAILPYDYLILLCGRQFIMPVPLALVSDAKICRRGYKPRCSLFKYLIMQQPKETEDEIIYPANAFIINTDVDATNAFISLQYLIKKRGGGVCDDEKIIIYGHHICTYLCINSLLKYGIQPKMIAVVEPFPKGVRSLSCLEDENIDKAVLKEINELGIDHYLGYVLYNWTLCEKNQIQSAVFHSDFRKITIKCLAMFPFDRKCVSDVTFRAVNDASLVYDGKLVINNSFQTNDPYIYAAGGLTKYKRKYYAKNKSHRNYNQSEVGKYLANIFKKKIDPTDDSVAQEPSELVPKMTQPVITYGVLPGEWYYYNARKPGKPEDPEISTKASGDILITGDCEMTKGYGYFKLTLDDGGFVVGILCYTKDVIDWENFELLYGKHEKLLNDLLLRFDLGMITDFFSYFREPWIYAIFHDRFKYVLWKNKDMFYEETPPDKKEKVIDVIMNTLKENNWQRPSKDKLREIKEIFNESQIKENITENILSFLYYFDEPFPMYATPRILRVLLHDANKSLCKPAVDSIAGSKPVVKISDMADLYLCTPIKINPQQSYFITGFEPNATMHTAHHMMVYGCATPGSDKAVWNCGEMASQDENVESAAPCLNGIQIIYAWAKDAPKLELPNGVGFKVGKGSSIKYLVLQVHYGNVDHFKEGQTDDSGVFLEYTERPLSKLAGVLLLGTKGYIAPGKEVEHMETSCPIKENKIIYPFAYRTHTHSLGLVVSGYRVVVKENGKNEWNLLGKRNPQTPQMFYPVEDKEPIKEGDIVAARCTMKSRKNKYTYIGAKSTDEMCNFYLMYYVEKDDPLEMKYCFTDGPPYYYWFRSEELNNIPDEEASQL